MTWVARHPEELRSRRATRDPPTSPSALRIGSALLTAVLLGVPRALDARAFGRTRSVYLEVADPSPGLDRFARELTRALERAGRRPAARPGGTTTVVDVHGLWPAANSPGAWPAVSLTVQEGGRSRHIVLRYRVDCEATAARALLDALDAPTR